MASKGIAVALIAGLLGTATYVAVRKAGAKPGEERKVGPRYYRETVDGMPADLYARYERCMQGLCSFDEVSALADEMREQGYHDFHGDLATLAADMLGVSPDDEVPPPSPPPVPPGSTSPGQPQTEYGREQVAREFANEIDGNCGKVLRDDVRMAQEAIGAQPTGIYDAQTAYVLASLGVIPPPPPCELPLPADWNAHVERWTEQIMNNSGLSNAALNQLLEGP